MKNELILFLIFVTANVYHRLLKRHLQTVTVNGTNRLDITLANLNTTNACYFIHKIISKESLFS